MADHQRIICSCGAVIAQCRCPGPRHTETRLHPTCELLTGDKALAEPNPGDVPVMTDLTRPRKAAL